MYQLERTNGIIQFELEPGSHAARFQWKDTDGKTLIDLDLRSIQGITIEKRCGQKFMNFIFPEDRELKNLIIRTKPDISITWGTEGF